MKNKFSKKEFDQFIDTYKKIGIEIFFVEESCMLILIKDNIVVKFNITIESINCHSCISNKKQIKFLTHFAKEYTYKNHLYIQKLFKKKKIEKIFNFYLDLFKTSLSN